MSVALPRMIHPNGFATIRAESIRLEEVATKLGGSAWEIFSEDLVYQQLFLEYFEKSFSIKHSISMTGVEYRHYQKWRRTSISFVEAFNDTIEQWADEMYSSAANRARGHLLKDDDTDSGFKEDAEGTPIYHGSDTVLTKSFLRAMYPEQFNEKIDMNLQGGLNNTNTPIDKTDYMALREAFLKEDDC